MIKPKPKPDPDPDPDLDYSSRDTKAKIYRLQGGPCKMRICKSESKELLEQRIFNNFKEFLTFAREHRLRWRTVPVTSPEYWEDLVPKLCHVRG